MEAISTQAIDRVLSLAPARTIEVGGFTYIDKDKNVTLFTPPAPQPTTVHTLSGLVGLLESDFLNFSAKKCLLHVFTFERVDLEGLLADEYGRRQIYAKAEALKPERVFEFNKYIPQEEFNIALRSMFVQDDELNALVAVAGNIAKETEVRQEDDGFAQRVTAKAGVHLVKEVTVKPRVVLRPFRTFLEVEQPEGQFIFRVKHDEQRGNLCALFEADGGRWKLEAMSNVRTWLENRLKTSEVTTLPTIPVIA